MKIFNRIKYLFKKPEYFSFESFNIQDYKPRFEYLSDEILIDITQPFEESFKPKNLVQIVIEIEDLINQEIIENEEYKKENGFSITYFFHSDFFRKKQAIFLSQVILSDNDEIGQTITSLYSFELKGGKIKIQDLN